MPEPLAGDEDRRPDVEAKRVVLEGRAVALAHEEANETLVRLLHLLFSAREADAGSVDDREVVGHGVVEPYEAVIEDLDLVLR